MSILPPSLTCNDRTSLVSRYLPWRFFQDLYHRQAEFHGRRDSAVWDFVGLKVLRAIEISLSPKRVAQRLYPSSIPPDRYKPLTAPKKVGHAAGCIAGDQAAFGIPLFTFHIKHLYSSHFLFNVF